MTQTGADVVRNRAKRAGISLAEVFERWGRGIAVDEGSATQLANQKIGFDLVLRSLRSFSRNQLNQLIKAIGDILVNPEPRSLKQLIADYKEIIAESYGEDVFSRERIDEIIQGQKPTPAEEALLAAILPLETDEFNEMISREFNNGNNHQECGSNSR